jgi:hypothetical protein
LKNNQLLEAKAYAVAVYLFKINAVSWNDWLLDAKAYTKVAVCSKSRSILESQAT